jgi:multidrug efflux pump subunit AcrA (membrane-fusion protein)
MRQRPIAERMSELQQRIEALRRSKQQLEARQAAAERKRQERRRYLLGSFLLERLGEDGPWRELVRRELPAFLKEERDRRLFAGLLDGSGGNGEAEILEALPDAAPTEGVSSTEMPGVGLERHEAG